MVVIEIGLNKLVVGNKPISDGRIEIGIIYDHVDGYSMWLNKEQLSALITHLSIIYATEPNLK